MLGRVLLPLPPHNSFPPPTWGIPRPPRRSRPLFGNDHRGTKWDRGPGSFPRRPLQGPSWTPPGPPAALQTGPARSENAEGRGEDWPRAGHRAAPGRGRPRGPRPPDSPRPRGTGGAGRGGPAPATSFADPSHRPAGPRPSCPRPTAAIPAHGSPPTRHIGDGVGGLCPRTVPYDHHRVLSAPPQRTPGRPGLRPRPRVFASGACALPAPRRVPGTLESPGVISPDALEFWKVCAGGLHRAWTRGPVQRPRDTGRSTA